MLQLSECYDEHDQVIESELFTVNTWKWARYSAHLSGVNGFYTALMELIRNAIDAVYNEDRKMIEIYIDKNTAKLIIEDSGYGMSKEELKQCIQWAESSHKGPNNEFGTGDQVALSFCYSENNGSFVIASRKPGEKTGNFIYSPFGENMNVQVKEWKLNPVMNTHIETDIESDVPIPSTEEIVKEISLRCWAALSDGISITINGQTLLPLVPGQICKSNGSYGSKMISVNGYDHVVKWVTYELKKDEIWEPEQARQGAYFFLNGSLMSHEQLKLIKTSPKGFSNQKTHPSYNALVTFIELRGPHQQSGLPVNSCKTEIDWASKNGKKFRYAIADLISEPYHKKNETETRITGDSILKSFGFAYRTEVYIDMNKEEKADGVLFNIQDPQISILINQLGKGESVLNHAICKGKKVRSLVEWKNKEKTIGKAELGQIIGYVSLFQKNYGYIPKDNIVIGQEITPAAEAALDLLYKTLRIRFVPTSELNI